MKQAWQHFLQYKPLLKELVRRDLKVKYRRSFLGYVWSLLNPLLMMCVMTLVFSYTGRVYVYNVLKRHGWRKKMPRSRHPKAADQEACEASKKLRPVYWMHDPKAEIKPFD